MRSVIRPAVVLLVFFTVVTGILYPLAITGIAQLAVARVRGLDGVAVPRLIAVHAQHPLLGVFGEPRANVLALNLALDSLAPATGSR